MDTTETEPVDTSPTRAVDSKTRIRAAVAIANVPALLMLVFQFTGDERWLAAPHLPTKGKGLGDHDDGGLPISVQDKIREAAVQAILSMESGCAPAIESPDEALTLRMMSVCMGEPIDAKFGSMLATELARRVSPEHPDLRPETVAVPRGFEILVIGAGVAGIAAAQQLEEMGIDYAILEKQPAPGGAWWQNTYPGAGVDTPSHLYSFYFAKNDWSKHFELRDDLQRYFSRVMDETASAGRVRYGTEATSARYDARTRRWKVEVRDGNGGMETLECNVLLSAVGSLATGPACPTFRA